jgi:hypothetical protein
MAALALVPFNMATGWMERKFVNRRMRSIVTRESGEPDQQLAQLAGLLVLEI